ncbi:hypothetical protein N7499_002366 [Penicillium canescens]|nr:hypothetical protein N7499_002366 [Penicillium canescens]
MGITTLDLTIEEEEKAIVQLIEQAVHHLAGTMFVTGARRHEPALHPDSEQTLGCLRLIGDMGAHEEGDLAQTATKEDDHRQEDSHPEEKKGSGRRRRFGVQNRLSMMEDPAIHLVATIARDGRATQHRPLRVSDHPGGMAHQPLASTNSLELLRQERRQKFCRRKVQHLVPAETTRLIERARTEFYHHDMLRLRKSSLHNQRLYLNVHLQPWKKLVSRHKDHVVAHRPETTVQAHILSQHQGHIKDRGRHPTHIVGYCRRRLALAVDQARVNLGWELLRYAVVPLQLHMALRQDHVVLSPPQSRAGEVFDMPTNGNPFLPLQLNRYPRGGPTILRGYVLSYRKGDVSRLFWNLL